MTHIFDASFRTEKLSRGLLCKKKIKTYLAQKLMMEHKQAWVKTLSIKKAIKIKKLNECKN